MRQILVIRKDLNMRKGKMAAQAAHASIAFLLEKLSNNLPLTKDEQEWIDTGQTKICVGVESENELIEIYNKSIIANIHAHLITDLGKTEFDGPTKTAVGIGPADENVLESLTGHLKLL